MYLNFLDIVDQFIQGQELVGNLHNHALISQDKSIEPGANHKGTIKRNNYNWQVDKVEKQRT